MTTKRSLSGEPVATPPSGRAPERVTMRGRLVTVEPLDPARHGEELYAASHETAEARRIWSYLPDGPFADRSAFDAWLAGMRTATDRVVFAFRDLATGSAAGMANYLDIRPAHGAIEIGYIWFAPSLQRTPPATEALYLMLRYAFDELRYRRMQWRCNALNEKSRAAALRLGFTFEGIFHQHMVVKGHNRDTAWYSILDGEWPRLRAGFEAWLAPENFDAEGRQRQSLRHGARARNEGGRS
jgi:RimJ/RimL family protein N-acetyltransferase